MSADVNSAAVAARIYQTPVATLPDDLYIPPQAFAIWLEQFEGPLDFLLYLVKKNNFDLTDTAILPITEQYLAYISELDENHFELAGDYLLMASTLIAIKTELLLPKPDLPADERDPKAELIARLEEYAQIKEVSRRLDALLRLERDVFLAMTSLPDPEVTAAELPRYPASLLSNSLIKMQLKPDYQMHTVSQDSIPLEDRIASITQQLSTHKQARFADLLDKRQGKLGVVVSFVAVLELIKRQLINVVYPPLTNQAHTDDSNNDVTDLVSRSTDAQNDATQSDDIKNNDAQKTTNQADTDRIANKRHQNGSAQNLMIDELTLQWVNP